MINNSNNHHNLTKTQNINKQGAPYSLFMRGTRGESLGKAKDVYVEK